MPATTAKKPRLRRLTLKGLKKIAVKGYFRWIAKSKKELEAEKKKYQPKPAKKGKRETYLKDKENFDRIKFVTNLKPPKPRGRKPKK